jgi:hypothetical protein
MHLSIHTSTLLHLPFSELSTIPFEHNATATENHHLTSYMSNLKTNCVFRQPRMTLLHTEV